MARIISVANRKGGLGKSSITMFLCSALAITDKKKVLLVDADNQLSAYNFHQLEKQSYDEAPPYTVEKISPIFLHDYLRLKANDYEYIFIDLPRMTDDSKDSSTVQAITYCDSILIPVVAGQFDALSTNDFLQTIKKIADFKHSNDFDFVVHGFLNKKDRRKDNEKVVSFMKKAKLSMFDNSLSLLSIFTQPSTYESILSTKGGRKRFEPFYTEFKEKFGIK